MSNILIILNPVTKTKPLTNKTIPKSKTKFAGIIWKIPNNQKTIAINISKMPNIFTIIFKL